MISHVESENYNKLLNITKKKQTYRYKEQASGYQWRGRTRVIQGAGVYKVLGV